MIADLQSANWQFTSAQTNAVLLAATATQRIEFYGLEATAAGSNTGDVSCDVGFSSTGSLPTMTPNSLTPRVGICFSHGGVVHGGGAAATRPVVGALGEDLLLTCSAATGGDFRVSVSYRIVEPIF